MRVFYHRWSIRTHLSNDVLVRMGSLHRIRAKEVNLGNASHLMVTLGGQTSFQVIVEITEPVGTLFCRLVRSDGV